MRLLSPVPTRTEIAISALLAHYHQVRDAWGGVRTPDGR
jgi:hypothetical protein